MSFSSLLLAEDREVNITFRMCLEVGYKAVGTLYDMVQVVVERRVAHQFAECSVGVLYLCHHGVDAADGLIDTVQCGLQVKLV